jgi:hypothetical protein
MSCWRAAAAISRTGSTLAVGEVIWSTISSLVFPGRNAPRSRETTSPSEASSGRATVRALAPSRRHWRRTAIALAPYP